jgi:hypothetical protein
MLGRILSLWKEAIDLSVPKGAAQDATRHQGGWTFKRVRGGGFLFVKSYTSYIWEAKKDFGDGLRAIWRGTFAKNMGELDIYNDQALVATYHWDRWDGWSFQVQTDTPGPIYDALTYIKTHPQLIPRRSAPRRKIAPARPRKDKSAKYTWGGS